MNKTTLTIVLVLFFGLFLGQSAMAQQAVKTKITSEKEVKASTTDKDVSQAKPQLKDSKSATKPCCSSAKKADCSKKADCAKTSDKCCDKNKSVSKKAKVRTTEKSTDKK